MKKAEREKNVGLKGRGNRLPLETGNLVDIHPALRRLDGSLAAVAAVPTAAGGVLLVLLTASHEVVGVDHEAAAPFGLVVHAEHRSQHAADCEGLVIFRLEPDTV